MEHLDKLAKSLDMSVSALIRMSVLEGPPAKIQRADPELKRQMAKIGNNINQIARLGNYRAKIGESIEIVQMNVLLRQNLQTVKSLCF